MSRGSITFRAPQDGKYVLADVEDMGEVTTYVNDNGELSVQIDTGESTGRLRVVINDAAVYEGDPDAEEVNGLHLFRELFKELALTEPPKGSALDTVLEEYQEAYYRTEPWLEQAVCVHCQRRIVRTEVDGWMCPEAGYDVESGDGIWRLTCEDHDTVTAEHEPGA
jgi:hypothetical protein